MKDDAEIPYGYNLKKSIGNRIKEGVKDFLYYLPCKLGLHQIEKTDGIYQSGKCKKCGLEGMFF